MNTTFADFVGQFRDIINSIIALLVAVAILVFFMGIVKMMFAATNNPKAYQEGKYFMIWGVIALFVMTALGGILNLFANDIFGRTVFRGGTVPTYTESDADRAFDFPDDGGIDLPDDGGFGWWGGFFPGGGTRTSECGYNANGQYVCSGFRNDCVLDNKFVRDGSSEVFYSFEFIGSPQTCASVAQRRHCSNGVLSGDRVYQYAHCSNVQTSR